MAALEIVAIEESIYKVAEEIVNLSQPRPYDWLVLIVAFVSILASTVVAIVIPRKIELKQNDLQRRQIKIALYEHRLRYWNVAKDIYFFLKDYLDFMNKTNYKEKTNEDIYKEYLLLRNGKLKDVTIHLKEAEFVFPPDMWNKLQETAKRIDNTCYYFSRFQLAERKIATDEELREKFDQNITREYIYETRCIVEDLLRAMEIYLTISDLDVWEGIYSSKNKKSR